jgi:hypothetical protein
MNTHVTPATNPGGRAALVSALAALLLDLKKSDPLLARVLALTPTTRDLLRQVVLALPATDPYWPTMIRRLVGLPVGLVDPARLRDLVA